MRAIDADALITDIKECIEVKEDNYEFDQSEGLKVALECIDDQPTIEPERKTGKWIPHKSIFWGLDEPVYTCDKCGHTVGFHAENFCPNCGADMRGDSDVKQ